MKKLLVIIGAFVSVVAIIAVIAFGAVFYFTSGMVSTANSFFEAVQKQDFVKARDYLAEEFKASTNEAALRDYLSKSAILNVKETSWTERSISGSKGELAGSITTTSGGAIPIKLTFVKEGDQWKIYTLQKPSAGIQSQASSPSIPAKEVQIALVKQSMHDFAVSVNNKNMEHFRSTVSQLWQKQFTTEKLNEAFKAVIDAGIDLTVLDGLAPLFAGEPSIDENGVLTIEGRYATKPSQVAFRQSYIYEGAAWKLVGFNINIK